MKKKILSVVLSLVMLAGLLPVGIIEAANTLPGTVTAISTNTTVSGSMEEVKGDESLEQVFLELEEESC